MWDEAKIVKSELLTSIVMVLHTFYHVVWSVRGGGFEVVQRSNCVDIQQPWIDIHSILFPLSHYAHSTPNRGLYDQ
jgi:bacteriorhodopsin